VSNSSSELADRPPNQRRLRNNRTELDDAAEAIVSSAEVAGYPKASCFALRLTIEEAVNNAFKHGHRDLGPEADVRLAWEVSPEKITIVVEDQGPGFDPEALPDPTAEENIEKPTGRGLLLIRAYMSSVEFNEDGNRVTMVYLHPDRAGS